MGKNPQHRDYRRIGDTAKCPACGISIDAEAYRCPKCRIYFCFKCRVRVTEREPQFQCADQSCQYYGKLLCAACTVMVPQDLPQTYHTETKLEGEPGNFGKLLVGGAVVGGATFFFAPFVVAAGAAAATVVGGGIVLNRLGVRVFSNQEEKGYQVADPPEQIEHRCCVGCRHPVKELD
ncbi:MAG: hypothetical protein GXY83_11295 [Rhodopirellula sp.]|nr:hypothetical protein [Rhodopirellula sp.]